MPPDDTAPPRNFFRTAGNKKFHAVKIFDREEIFLVDGCGLFFPGRERRLPLDSPVHEEHIRRAMAVIRRLPRLKHPGSVSTGELKVFIEGIDGYVCNGSTIIACHRLGIPMAFAGVFPRVAVPRRAILDRHGTFRSSLSARN